MEFINNDSLILNIFFNVNSYRRSSLTTTQEVTAWRLTDMFTFLRGENYQIVKQCFNEYSQAKRLELDLKAILWFTTLQKCEGVRTEIMSATSMSISTAVAWAGKQKFD